MNLYLRWGKRALDLSLAVPMLILFSPVMAVVGALVRIKLGSPVLFRHRRPGLNGDPFEMVKFRTMTDDVDASGELLPDADRLSKFGQTLRSTSLDESPELINVIKGDMSLVGPRPLLMKYLPLYTDEQKRRHLVRPGITGWAQVNGRNNAAWPEKFENDAWYVDHVSFHLDVRILWRTVVAVVRRSDVSQDGHATAPDFTHVATNQTAQGPVPIDSTAAQR